MKQTSFSYLALRIVLALLVLLMLGFCVFGFMATFEPMAASQQWLWRGIYATVGGGCIWGLARLLVSVCKSI